MTLRGLLQAKKSAGVYGSPPFLFLLDLVASQEIRQYKMLTLEFPRFRYLAKDLGVAGPGEIFVGFRGKAKHDAAVANAPMRAILRNSTSAY